MNGHRPFSLGSGNWSKCPQGVIPRDRGACLAGNRHAPCQNNARSGKSRMDWFVRRCVKLT